MDVQADGIEIQERHDFARRFNRGASELDRLAEFLNQQTAAPQSRWRVERKEKDDDSKVKEDHVLIESVQLDDSSAWFVSKVTIDSDSVFWQATTKGRILTEQDEAKQEWPEWARLRSWLQEFYKLDDAFFEANENKYYDEYLTRTDGVHIHCKFQRLLHPELWQVLKSSVTEAYGERGLATFLHPWVIGTKVQFSPAPETMPSLSPQRIRLSIGKDDLNIIVKRFEDYNDMIVSFASQMPFHAHVKAVRKLAEVSNRIAKT
ncbi:MAG: hypothetical protein KAV00_06690 [Phycisphaerae bacterium]|nr:hypothetical protein [Phycisphaerae bacterium]